MPEPLLTLSDVGVRAVETRSRTRRSNLPTVLGAKVKERVWPIRHLDFTMQPGETVFVTDVGASRPAVFFRMVCGMIPIDEGQARLPARTVLSYRMRGRMVRGLSIGQVIRMTCGLHGMPDRGIERRFDDMVAFAEVGKFLHLTVDAVPRQVLHQAQFAATVAVPADLYTFDGTAFVGTADFRLKCGIRLKELASQGRGLMISGAGPRLLRTHGDRGLVLDGEDSRAVSIDEFLEVRQQAMLQAEKNRRRRKKRDRGT